MQNRRTAVTAAVALILGVTAVTYQADTNAAAATHISYDAVVLADSPVMYARLGGSTDASGTVSHTVRYKGGPTRTTLPNGDPASVFNGTNQYAQVADANDLSVTNTGILTMEAWFRPDVLNFPRSQPGGYVHWMGKGVRGQHEYVSRIYNKASSRPNRISGYAYNVSGGLGAGSYFQDTVTAGRWIHYGLVINRRANSIKIYKNGVLRDTDRLSGYRIVPRNGTAPFRIGTRDFGSYFKGAIAKVAIYNKDASREFAGHVAAMK